jgi:hypothetical protein
VRPGLLLSLLLVISASLTGCGTRKSPDFGFMDEYLNVWDKFAQGDNGLISRVKKDAPEF